MLFALGQCMRSGQRQYMRLKARHGPKGMRAPWQRQRLTITSNPREVAIRRCLPQRPTFFGGVALHASPPLCETNGKGTKQ